MIVNTRVKPKKSKFVIVASIASEITSIMGVTKEISLAAGNAKAIAFRAGEKAKGFQPITDFINELAKETLNLVNEINDNALSLYKIAIKEYRINQALIGFNSSGVLINSGNFNDSLIPVNSMLEKELFICREELSIKIEQLINQLDDIIRPARAARVIAANSRIEASQADEYLQSLQGIAESVDNAAQVIYDNVQHCRSILSMIDSVD